MVLSVLSGVNALIVVSVLSFVVSSVHSTAQHSGQSAEWKLLGVRSERLMPVA